MIRLNEQGIYFFHQGTNYEAYELLGAHYTKDSTTFRVWAPNARSVSVVGDFNGWNKDTNVMNKITNEGLYEIVITSSVLYMGESVFVMIDWPWDRNYEMIIYCETEVKPDGWSDSWNSNDCSVEWGYNGNDPDNPKALNKVTVTK